MAAKGSKTIPNTWSTNKYLITATSTVTLDGNFLPPQLIYGGKTTKSFPCVEFPSSFCLSANSKHYSNESESIKILEDIIFPYVNSEKKTKKQTIQLPSTQPALLIMDVSKGQMTNVVLNTLQENGIFLITVPANLTYLFQPPDLHDGPNGYVKRVMKNTFC